MQGRFYEIQGQKIFVYKKGNGPNLLLIHGHRGDALRMKGVVDFLSPYFTVYAPDLPGFGKSPPFRGQWHTLEAYAEVLVGLTDNLDPSGLVLGGISMGGLVVLLSYPQIKRRVKKMLLIGTPVSAGFLSFSSKRLRAYQRVLYLGVKSRIIPWLGDRIIGSDSIFPRLLKRMLSSESLDKEIIDYEVRQWRVMPFRIWMETVWAMLDVDLTKTNLKVDVPTLIIESQKSQYYDVKRNLAELKKIAPNSRVVFLPWGRHVPLGDIPAEFFEGLKPQVLPFLLSGHPEERGDEGPRWCC